MKKIFTRFSSIIVVSYLIFMTSCEADQEDIATVKNAENFEDLSKPTNKDLFVEKQNIRIPGKQYD